MTTGSPAEGPQGARSGHLASCRPGRQAGRQAVSDRRMATWADKGLMWSAIYTNGVGCSIEGVTPPP